MKADVAISADHRAPADPLAEQCARRVVAPNIESFHIDKTIPGSVTSYLPDVTNYGLRDYGSQGAAFFA